MKTRLCTLVVIVSMILAVVGCKHPPPNNSQLYSYAKCPDGGVVMVGGPSSCADKVPDNAKFTLACDLNQTKAADGKCVDALVADIIPTIKHWAATNDCPAGYQIVYMGWNGLHVTYSGESCVRNTYLELLKAKP